MQLREIQLRDPRADGRGGGGVEETVPAPWEKPRFLKNPVARESGWRPGKTRSHPVRVETKVISGATCIFFS